MWNRHPVVRQEKLDRETEDNRLGARIRREVLDDEDRYEGTSREVKRLTGQERIPRKK